MDFILKVAHPDMGIFTAIDAVHSEQFGNPAEIANEESKMALHTKELVFLNHDDSYAMQLSPRLQVDKLTYQTKGYGEKADISFRACDFLLGAEQHEIKSAFSLDIKGKAYNITTNLIGKANYGYIGVALAIVEILGYRSSWIEEKHKRNYNALSNTSETIDLTYTLQPGRLSIFAGKYESILFDSTYNASPQSVRSIIDTVITIRSHLFPQSEIWLILGDMRELGDLTEQEHRYLAGYVSQVADKLFLLGQSMQNYLADELEKVGFDQKKSYLAGSLKELNKQLEKELKKADKKIPLLVFKGSQNTIFLEESVKHFLLDNADEASLTRQGKFWEAKKKDYC
jgi:UDP-N-acetylmuramoyl-tripeptide--D-alanyl-D-alanine ligase